MSKKSESASRGDSLDAEMTSLKVAVRVRPLNDKEVNLGSKIVVDVHGNDVIITDLKVPEHQGYDHRSRVHKFSFDYGFSSVDPEAVQYASQTTVFENFGRVVLQALLEGYNCCVIAYGQSGSGKTYTMMGMKDEEGLAPRICEGLLMKLEDNAKQNISFAVNISYMEIYNEQVYDLLQKPDERTNLNKSRLRVREHPIHGPFVEGLSTHVLRSRDNVCQLISEGNDNRIKAATYIHDRSSRSHAIFTVHCSQACLDESQPKEVVSKLQLVDLAGSEKAEHEFCQSRLKEGASINKSLVALGNVISALVELSQRFQNGSCKGNKQLFVPYRDSQLTWLMKDSLGGNSHTFMLAAVSPTNECCSETLSTLRYAQRAKSVLSIPIVNEDPATKIIRNLRSEVNKLKSLLINADVLSRKAVIEPLSNLSHLNSIMKKSEKKVDHLTRCWFEKWKETYNAVLKKTSDVNEESSTVTKGTDVLLEKQNVASTAERTDTTTYECNIKLNSSGSQCSLRLKAEDSDAILSDKSSSVSSECIILPNETIFYSKGKRNHGLQNYLNECESYFKSASSNHVDDTKCEIITPPDKFLADSTNPIFNFHSSSLNDVTYCRNTFSAPEVLNSLSVSTPTVHNSVSLDSSLLTSFSLPKVVQALPESLKTTKENKKEDTDFLDSSGETNNFLEKTCQIKEACSSSQVIIPAANHAEDCHIYETDAEVRSGLNRNEFPEHEIRSDIPKDYLNTPDHSICGMDTEKTLHADLSGGKDCSNGCSASNSFKNCMTNISGETHSCREVEFNDSVTEESDNLVKLLNRLQDGSVEAIGHCFQRKDSEILSLLSLSSSDYPPFHSLDDIFNDDDDVEVPDGAGGIEFGALCESQDKYENWYDKYENWYEIHSSSDVTDLSDSSDAESEFDYLDFTKNTTTHCKTAISCDSSVIVTSNKQQNFQNSEFMKQINRCNENLFSIPENAPVPQTINSNVTALNAVESCYQEENTDMNCDATTVARSETKLESENSVHTEEVSHELSSRMCKNVNTDKFSVLCSKNLTAESKSHTNENVNNMKALDVKHFTAYVQKNPMMQKRLCSSDSIIKTSPSSEIKYCSKSDNTVYVAPEEFSIPSEFSSGRNRNESTASYENVVNNDSITKTLFRNKDSISDLLGFSVQDILDMINGKGVAQCGAALKKQVHPMSDEKLQYDNAIPEEIQKFIDNTEITDASKLADELLKKKLPQCLSSVTSTLTNNDTVLSDDNCDQNKVSSKSIFCSSYSDTESSSYTCQDEKSSYQNLDTRLNGSIHSKTEKMNMEKILDTKESSNVTSNTHITDIIHKIENVNELKEVKVQAGDNSEDNRKFKYEKLHMAVEEVHCEKENALEYFTYNGCKEVLLGSLSDESDYLDNDADSVNKTKELSESQEMSAANDTLGAKEIKSSAHLVEVDAVPYRPDFQNFPHEYPDDTITDGNSPAKIYTDYSMFGNLNITGLAPIQEEVADEDDDDDAISEASEDDSPNISFQFDSLERPKNVPVVKKDQACVDNTPDAKDNTEELHNSANLSNMLNDVSKTFCCKSYDLPVETCTETEKQGQNKELSNFNFNHAKCIEIPKETPNPKNMLELSSTSNFEENLIKTSADTCKLAAEFQYSQEYPSSYVRENYNKCNVISEEINTNVESPKNNLKVKMNNSKEVNNLPNQLCSWDSLSSSTSSDSITFVFVGKENKDVMLENNSRSFQSSLFSSVSLDSLEKSSFHQNQVTCTSPRTLSIDSLVAEELLFQLRNSDPVQPLTNEITQYVDNKCELNSTNLTDQKLEPEKTNFAATSQLSSNQHLKMYHHMHGNVGNDIFLQDAATDILGRETLEKQNTINDTTGNQIVTYHSNSFPSGSYCGDIANKFQNSRERYSCISPESNGDAAEQIYNYLKTANSKEHNIAENVCCISSNDCNKENSIDDIRMCEIQKHTAEENVFNTCTNSSITASHLDHTNFENQYDLSLQSNSSNLELDICNGTTFDESLEPVIVDNCGVMQKQSLPDTCYRNNGFCDKCITNDHDELISLKELTEENLKIFNSEFEANQEENFILPPPSTFGGSDDNGLSVMSNCSSFSLANNQSKTSVDVFSKSTQTDQNFQTECNKSGENSALMDSGNTDLIERMMDLMAETLQLMKEQYSRTPKRSESHVRKKLAFSSDSDKNMSDLKQKTVVRPTSGKHRKYLSKEKSTDNKVMKYIQSILPPENESDYAIENFSQPLAHSELLPYPQKIANEKSLSMKNKVNHNDQRIGCAIGKKPNFYTLPFDFITCKYQCKKSSNASKLKKPDTISQTSVDNLPDKAKHLNLIGNEYNNLSAFKLLSAEEQNVSGINEVGLKQSLPMPGSSRSHLKHLIELRRQVVEATTGTSNAKENLNCESQITNPLKSPSSSSEGYLSSVSSRGPFRHLSEASTDSQEFNSTAQHLFQKQRFPKHNVKPLDFSTQHDGEVAVSSGTRWLNTSADSGAFFLDSPGTEKRANLDEYPPPTTTTNNRSDFTGPTSSAACTSTKKPQSRSPLHHGDILATSINPQEAKIPSLSRIKKLNEIKNGRKEHKGSDFAFGFQELDEIGENYMDISLRESVSVNSSTSSDLPFCTGKPQKNRNPKSSRQSRNSPRLKHVSSQEIQRLLESIENDRRLLQQIQHNHVFNKIYSPSRILPSCSSLEMFDDLFYQDTYKSLPSPHGCLNSSASYEV